MQTITEKHPIPWAFEARGDTSAIVDAMDQTVLELPWDGKQSGNGGVNDLLCLIAVRVTLIGFKS